VIFIDTNVFVQALARSHEPGQEATSRQAAELLLDVTDGKVEATTSEAVIAEVLYVSTAPRLYARSIADVRTVLQPLLEAPGMRFGPAKRYVRALEVCEGRPGLKFVDALTIAYVEQGDVQLASFDRQLLGSPGVTPYWQATDDPL